MNGNGSSPAGGPRAHLVVFALLEGGWYASMAAMFAGFPVLLVASLHLRWPPAVSVWAAAMMAMLLLSLRVRGREGAPGRLLGREEAPGLRALVDEARRVAGIGPVGEIRVTALPNVGVTRVFRGGILYCRPVKVLLVGLPCLRALTVPELASILVHEFAHFLGQDVHRGERLAVIDARVGNLQAAFERTGPLRWLSPVYLWARAYGAFFTVATARIRRRQEILAALRAVRRGESVFPPAIRAKLASARTRGKLTEKEMTVLRAIVRGRSNKEIAAEMNLAEVTVKFYVGRILEKLGVLDRTQAATAALQRGIIHLE
ncbi:MAG: hypothetical protein HUU06_10985 [Planctomycetaceae bacterium]|nr:hypothetical protein [Planctomycetaceae bacterium]